jgi:hypothetical protein
VWYNKVAYLPVGNSKNETGKKEKRKPKTKMEGVDKNEKIFSFPFLLTPAFTQFHDLV